MTRYQVEIDRPNTTGGSLSRTVTVDADFYEVGREFVTFLAGDKDDEGAEEVLAVRLERIVTVAPVRHEAPGDDVANAIRVALTGSDRRGETAAEQVNSILAELRARRFKVVVE